MNYIKIIELFNLASKELQYPKIRLMNDIVLSKAGAKASYPGSINITDGKPYGNNTWYGRIMLDGRLLGGAKTKASDLVIVKHELNTFRDNPYEYAKLYGKSTANCMFCAKTLTDPQSIAVGYGPVCAGHYGLPHGQLEQEVANELSQIEMEMPVVSNTTNELTKQQKEAGKWLAAVINACQKMIDNMEYANWDTVDPIMADLTLAKNALVENEIENGE